MSTGPTRFPFPQDLQKLPSSALRFEQYVDDKDSSLLLKEQRDVGYLEAKQEEYRKSHSDIREKLKEVVIGGYKNIISSADGVVSSSQSSFLTKSQAMQDTQTENFRLELESSRTVGFCKKNDNSKVLDFLVLARDLQQKVSEVCTQLIPDYRIISCTDAFLECCSLLSQCSSSFNSGLDGLDEEVVDQYKNLSQLVSIILPSHIINMCLSNITQGLNSVLPYTGVDIQTVIRNHHKFSSNAQLAHETILLHFQHSTFACISALLMLFERGADSIKKILHEKQSQTLDIVVVCQSKVDGQNSDSNIAKSNTPNQMDSMMSIATMTSFEPDVLQAHIIHFEPQTRSVSLPISSKEDMQTRIHTLLLASRRLAVYALAQHNISSALVVFIDSVFLQHYFSTTFNVRATQSKSYCNTVITVQQQRIYQNLAQAKSCGELHAQYTKLRSIHMNRSSKNNVINSENDDLSTVMDNILLFTYQMVRKSVLDGTSHDTVANSISLSFSFSEQEWLQCITTICATPLPLNKLLFASSVVKLVPAQLQSTISHLGDALNSLFYSMTYTLTDLPVSIDLSLNAMVELAVQHQNIPIQEFAALSASFNPTAYVQGALSTLKLTPLHVYIRFQGLYDSLLHRVSPLTIHHVGEIYELVVLILMLRKYNISSTTTTTTAAASAAASSPHAAFLPPSLLTTSIPRTLPFVCILNNFKYDAKGSCKEIIEYMLQINYTNTVCILRAVMQILQSDDNMETVLLGSIDLDSHIQHDLYDSLYATQSSKYLSKEMDTEIPIEEDKSPYIQTKLYKLMNVYKIRLHNDEAAIDTTTTDAEVAMWVYTMDAFIANVRLFFISRFSAELRQQLQLALCRPGFAGSSVDLESREVQCSMFCSTAQQQTCVNACDLMTMGMALFAENTSVTRGLVQSVENAVLATLTKHNACCHSIAQSQAKRPSRSSLLVFSLCNRVWMRGCAILPFIFAVHQQDSISDDPSKQALLQKIKPLLQVLREQTYARIQGSTYILAHPLPGYMQMYDMLPDTTKSSHFFSQVYNLLQPNIQQNTISLFIKRLLTDAYFSNTDHAVWLYIQIAYEKIVSKQSLTSYNDTLFHEFIIILKTLLQTSTKVTPARAKQMCIDILVLKTMFYEENKMYSHEQEEIYNQVVVLVQAELPVIQQNVVEIVAMCSIVYGKTVGSSGGIIDHSTYHHQHIGAYQTSARSKLNGLLRGNISVDLVKDRDINRVSLGSKHLSVPISTDVLPTITSNMQVIDALTQHIHTLHRVNIVDQLSQPKSVELLSPQQQQQTSTPSSSTHTSLQNTLENTVQTTAQLVGRFTSKISTSTSASLQKVRQLHENNPQLLTDTSAKLESITNNIVMNAESLFSWFSGAPNQ